MKNILCKYDVTLAKKLFPQKLSLRILNLGMNCSFILVLILKYHLLNENKKKTEWSDVSIGEQKRNKYFERKLFGFLKNFIVSLNVMNEIKKKL